MRRILFILIAIFCFPLLAFAQGSYVGMEKINSYDVTININEDSSIEVLEKINYDFGNLEKHGIYRDIPIKYQARGGNYSLKISDVQVVDENGVPYNFELSNVDKDKRIKIGDANKLVSGEKNYWISYKIKRAVNYFPDHDELYWNALGNNWEIPVLKSSVVVNLPKKVISEQLNYECYAGALSSKENCTNKSLDKENKSVNFSEDSLAARESLTIVVGFPKGTVYEPTKTEKLLEVIKDNIVLALPILTLIVLIFIWRRYGRDPKGKETIVVQYDVPDGLSPAEVGTIYDEKADNKDISAELIFLAIKGYIKINKLNEKILFFNKEDYRLDKLKDQSDLENGFQKLLMQKIFSVEYASKTESLVEPTVINSVRLSALKQKFYEDLQNIMQKVYSSTVQKGYFPKSPRNVKLSFTIGGVALGCSGILLSIYFGAYGLISGILSGILVIIFGLFMPRRTLKGVLTKEYILGLKEYLQVAEKDRIEFHNAPEKNPETFEKFLPYAMVLGVEKQWAKQFEGMYKQSPNWYSDPTMTHFSVIAFSNNLNDFSSTANSSMSMAASGGSGFSGGGAGGGFGGGGGGSW